MVTYPDAVSVKFVELMLILFDLIEIEPDSALISEEIFPFDTLSLIASALTWILLFSVSYAFFALVTSAVISLAVSFN